MLTRQDIEKKLRAEKTTLSTDFKVKRIGFFGSIAMNEQTEESDIDILVEFSKPVGWEYFDLQEYLENLFGRTVDLVTPGGLKPRVKKYILEQVIYA